MCEDLSTSWGKAFGGRAYENVRSADFLKVTMTGRSTGSMQALSKEQLCTMPIHELDFLRTPGGD
jgi:hypothetical protein